MTADMIEFGLILPAISLVALVAAGGVALYASHTRGSRRIRVIDAWDLAGGLAFIGCAAGMLSGAHYVMRLFGVS